jgi:hypothetical protein
VYRDVFQSGLVRVPEADLKGFAEGILSLLYDAALHEETSRAARSTASYYNFDAVAAREHRVLTGA